VATQAFPFAKIERENSMKKLSVLDVTALTGVLIAAAPFSLSWSPAKTMSFSSDAAQARVGHPLTPGSVAGVHRRVERQRTAVHIALEAFAVDGFTTDRPTFQLGL
jgi:hypothetical protein